MKRLLIIVTLALVTTLGFAPTAQAAQAKQRNSKQPDGITNPRFSSSDTQRHAKRIDDLNAEYDSNARRIQRMDDNMQTGPELDKLQSRQNEITKELYTDNEDLIGARIDAIKAAPVKGSPDQRVATLRDKQQAVRQLTSYATDTLDINSNYYVLGNSGGPYPDYANDISAAQARADRNQGQPNQKGATPQQAGGSEGGGGSGAAPLAGVGNAITGFIGFVISMIFWTALMMAVMFGLAWRREGHAVIAWRRTTRPGRIVLAAGIALVLYLLGDLVYLALLILAVALALLWWREGSAGGAIGLVRSWIPRGLVPGGEEPDGRRPGHDAPGTSGEAGTAPQGPTVGCSQSPRSEPREAYSPYRTARELLEEAIRRTGERHDISISYTEEAVSLLSEEGQDSRDGPERIRRTVRAQVESRISELVDAGKIESGARMELAVRDGQVAPRRITEKVHPSGRPDSRDDPPEDTGNRKRYCPECGSEVSVDARFCGQCGDPMTKGN